MWIVSSFWRLFHRQMYILAYLVNPYNEDSLSLILQCTKNSKSYQISIKNTAALSKQAKYNGMKCILMWHFLIALNFEFEFGATFFLPTKDDHFMKSSQRFSAICICAFKRYLHRTQKMEVLKLHGFFSKRNSTDSSI